MAGALGAGILSSLGASKMINKAGNASVMASPQISQPASATPPVVPISPAQEPASAQQEPARATEPQRQSSVVSGRNPHAGFPAELHDQSAADRNSRVRNFVSVMLPLVHRSNEQILAERRRLLTINRSLDLISPGDREWISSLATRYRVSEILPNGREKPLSTLMSDLLRRVDKIPEQLVLAQAALESGWGTSDLSRQANNMFGQKATQRNGEFYRIRNTDGLDYRRYDHPGHSIESYMHNLNSHPSYEDFRRNRAQLRRQQSMTPLNMSRELSNHLSAYSTSPEYPVNLRRIMAMIPTAR